MRAVMWTLDHLEDLESDFSAFHRCDDMYALDARTYLSRAVRIPAYDGATAVALRNKEQAQQEQAPAAAPVPQHQPVPQPSPSAEPTVHDLEQMREQARMQKFGRFLAPGEAIAHVSDREIVKEYGA